MKFNKNLQNKTEDSKDLGTGKKIILQWTLQQ
jgi:hypothetical protein